MKKLLILAAGLFFLFCSDGLREKSFIEPDGTRTGPFLVRNAPSNMRIVGMMRHDKLNSPVLFYSAQGDTQGIIRYKGDARNGEAMFWYYRKESNKRQVKFIAHYVNDTLTGVKESFFPDGARRARYVYDRGQLVSARAYTPAGKELGDADARKMSAEDRENDSAMYAQWQRFLSARLSASD